MTTLKKSAQVAELLVLLVAVSVLWGADSLRRSRGNGRHQPDPACEDDLTAWGSGSFVGS